MKTITLKLGNMRKPQEFVVYPYKNGQEKVSIQSDGRWATIEVATGKGLINSKNVNYPNSMSLMFNPIEITVDQETMNKIFDCQPKSGDRIGAAVTIA